MKICGACGQENPAIARFCLACAAPLASVDGTPREERRVVSVIFVDLVGFTGHAETLDPEDVRAVLAPYHDAVRKEIESFGGVVEKFIGDAVMGVFGAPTAFGDDPERAVRAALAVRDRVASEDGLQLRIAVHTGEALVTLEARPALGEAMVAGDVVNTAARLQTAATPNTVLVGDETWRATRDSIAYEPAEPVVAKGKSAPLAAWIATGAVVPQGERSFSSTFVGRSRELSVLRQIWHGVREERRPHLVTVVAAAGVVAGHLAILIGLDSTTPVADREALFFSIRCFIEAVARDQPTLLVFEDLHWADSSLLDLVELLGSRLRDLPIMILVLARPDLLDARPTWGGGLPAYMALPLGPLSDADAQELATQRLGALAGDERAADLAQTGAGNPLFIEQLAAALTEAPD